MIKATLIESEIIELYKTKSITEISRYLHTSDIRVKEILVKNGIPIRNRVEGRKLSCLQKYGVENFSETPFFKDKVQEAWENKSEMDIKETTNKRKNTKTLKYGDPNYNNPEKISKELSSKSPEEMEEIKSKREATILKLYGNSCFSKTEEFKIRTHNSWELKPEEEKIIRRNRIKNTYINTIKEKYGVDGGFVMSDKCRYAANSISSNSGPNKEFQQLLEENGFKISLENREFPLDHYIYDFKIDNVLIEINPTATHNSSWSPYGEDRMLPFDYHYKKTKKAIENGYKCLHVFDWTDKLEIIELLKQNTFTQIDIGPKLHIFNIRNGTHIVPENTSDCNSYLINKSWVKIYDSGFENIN